MTEPAAKKLKRFYVENEDALQNAVNSILQKDEDPLFELHSDTGSKDQNVHCSESVATPATSESSELVDSAVASLSAATKPNLKSTNHPSNESSSSSCKLEISGYNETRHTRDDRLPANETGSSEGTLSAVVAEHYNRLEEKGLAERNRSRIVHLRNFNNWMKSMLIDEYLNEIKMTKSQGTPLKVLDIGCGKGGDLLKWRQGNITHLVCADIASTSVDQCKERYQDMSQRAQRERNMNPIFTAEFIVANCTKERLREQYTDVTVKFDLVSCQFAFHYCFESLPQAECMMRNVSECLRPGGFFIGTCPNANAIVSRARKAGGQKFGNDVYSVVFESPLSSETSPPLFGAKYNFHMEGVVDCPEFLVHFPTFIRLASRYGLKCIACETFPSFFNRMKESGRGLLGKMQSLETYPPFPEQKLMGPISEYKHADDYILESKTTRKIGTLSSSEWEAATLYLVFAFKKNKENM